MANWFNIKSNNPTKSNIMTNKLLTKANIMTNELLTLSNRIKELSATTMSDQAKWQQIELDSELLNKVLEFKYFVACGEDGKPMDSPKDNFEQLSKNNGCALASEVSDYRKEYQEALKSVIFEGFKVVKRKSKIEIKIKRKGVYLMFNANKEIKMCEVNGLPWFNVNNLSRLAKVTSENPLLLR